MIYKICVLRGDGIGKEVVEEAVRVLQSLPIEFEFTYADIGYGCYLKKGDSLPQETLDKIEQSDSALFGAVTTPPNIPNYSSPILRLRQKLDLYINLRPIKYYPLKDARKNVDLVIFRENTEGLYSGKEREEDDGNTAITERVITRKASERIIRAAFEYALANKRKKVTLVHKANVLRLSDGLFRKIGQEISEDYPDIEYNEMIVDAMAMRLIKDPENFDVIVTTNLFGDILSDEASMLSGGLGISASGNIGKSKSVFEPVHGSAPDIAGKNIANPIAAILAAKMMLEHLGEEDQAKKIEDAVVDAIKNNKLTPELGGNLKTKEVTDHIIGELKK
jgi:isopropylmalate/isohomocitrate dehydrogenase-like protein